jgi:hypothetical protein
VTFTAKYAVFQKNLELHTASEQGTTVQNGHKISESLGITEAIPYIFSVQRTMAISFEPQEENR